MLTNEIGKRNNEIVDGSTMLEVRGVLRKMRVDRNKFGLTLWEIFMQKRKKNK